MSDAEKRDPRLDAAYRATPREEPPAEIDERIRAAARRAVSAGPQSADAAAQARGQRSWVSRWRVPVSLAATVLIVVTLTVMMQDEESRRAKLDVQMNGTPPAGEAPKPAAPAAEAARIDERTASPSAPTFGRRPSANGDTRAPAETQVPAPAPRESAKPSGPAANDAPAEERRQAGSATAVPQAARAVPAAPPPAVSPATAPPQGAPAASPPSEAAASPPVPFPAQAPAPALPAVPSRETVEALSRDRSVAERPTRMERGAVSAAAEPKARTPEAWLEEIRRLRAQGRDAEAAMELAEFRKRHPDFVLPPDFAK
jgi:hypothetical protein